MTKFVDQRSFNNPAFLDDDGKKNFIAAINKSDQESQKYTVELTEKKKFQGPNDGYDPYANRKVEHPTSNAGTLLHLLKGSLGTGILAMPNAFSHAGYLVGSVGTVVIGILCTYCIHLLVKAEYELCKRRKVPSMNYPTVAKVALEEGPAWGKIFAPYIVHVVNIFLLIYQLGTCCVYVVFVSSNLKSVADFYMEEKTDIRIYMVIILLPLILINWIRNLKFLVPFSTVANIVTLISFGIIAFYIFKDPITMDGKDAFGTIKGFPLFFGTVLFALEAIGVILPLENNMKTPKKFGGTFGVLNIAMTMIVILYVGMGLFGYLKFGMDSKGSITLNLPDRELLAQSVKAMLAFAIFITHGLACFVAIDITWNDYIVKKFEDSPRKLFYEYVTRTLLVLITFLLAVSIPSLELFISLFGALCLSALGLAFPALIQSCIYWNTSSIGQKVFLTVKNIIIGIIAILGLVIGTYTSLAEIVATFL